MNPPTILGAAAVLLFALAPSSAAVALTTPAAEAATLASPAHPAAVSHGNVVAIVPGSSIARDDGVGGVMRRGHTYRTEFVVWVAPNVTRATLSLRVNGAKLGSCTSTRLRPGTTSAVMCLVRGDTNAKSVVIDAVVQTANLGRFSRTFAHALTS